MDSKNTYGISTHIPVETKGKMNKLAYNNNNIIKKYFYLLLSISYSLMDLQMILTFMVSFMVKDGF